MPVRLPVPHFQYESEKPEVAKDVKMNVMGSPMKWIRILALLSAASLAVPSIAFAQDGPLGKKGGGKGGGNSGNSGSSGGGKSGGQSNSGGGRSNSGGGKSSGQSNSGGSVGLPGTPPRSTGGSQSTSNSGRPITIPREQYGAQVISKRGDEGSKSGKVQYGSNNNVRVEEGRYNGAGVTTIPRVSTSRDIGLEARGESRHVELGSDRNRGDYRFGYSHYRNDWCDDDFYYPFYAFRWDPWKTVPSPFYAYTHLPAYINCTRISIGSFSWTMCSTSYPYKRRGNDDPYGWGWGRDNRGSDLDYAVDDIYDAFRSGRMRSLGSMIGRSVVVEYGYSERYRMSGDDFYDLMRDVVEGTRTENYLIQDVYRDGDQATVIGYHTFYTPYGIRESVRHVYGLERVHRGYEIVYFRTERF